MWSTGNAVLNAEKYAKEEFAERMGLTGAAMRHAPLHLSEFGSWRGPAILWLCASIVTTFATTILAVAGIVVSLFF